MTNVKTLSPGRQGALRLLLVGAFDDGFYAMLAGQQEYATDLVLDSGEAAAAIRAGQVPFDVVLTGLNIAPVGGMEILRIAREADPDAPVILSTHETSPRVVVQAMQAGAFDYIIEPFDDYGLVRAVIARAAARRRTLLAARELSGELRRATGFPEIVGRSRASADLRKAIRRAASVDSTVLITGESGTGKGLVARAIHGASARAAGPLVTINCGAIPETLIESELFGHVRGAFTGAVADRPGRVEQADGGTLFLDEIAELSPAAQVKVLRFLEERRFEAVGDPASRAADVRIISATNRNLASRIAAGLFREDLFYRVNVLSISLQPLRELPDDLPLLAQHFLEAVAAETDKPVRAISPEAFAALQAHPWPGNARELRNVIERAVIWSSGEAIRARDLPPTIPTPTVDRGLTEHLQEVERRLILQALDACGWVRAKAAAKLQVPRSTLVRRMKELNIKR